MAADDKFHFAIDRGGTFTDVFAELPTEYGGGRRVFKLLSSDKAYADAPTEGIRRILSDVTGIPHPRGVPLDTSRIGSIRMGTTVATNALLERKGERFALVVTKGFADLLQIGNQSRPKIFDLRITVPSVIYERVVTIDERVILLPPSADDSVPADCVKVSTGDYVRVEQAPDLDAVRASLATVYDAGIRNLAVLCLHSYLFPVHEEAIGRVAQSMGFEHVTLSSHAMPMVKAVPRGFTACADAYLTPAIRRYVDGFRSGFDSGLSRVPVLFMQSDGGLTSVDKFSGFKAILSGPAGGVVGFALTTYGAQSGNAAVVGFDMGGTSTDVSRYAGHFEHVFETTTAGVTIQAPQMDVNTVAAGGGSRLFFRSGMFVVGPESAGATPGPVCYRKGGLLAVTDANLMLGRLVPEYFPHIFGPNENEALDAQATEEAFQELARSVNEYTSQHGAAPLSLDEIASGFIDVANEAMCRPIRELTQARGYDTKNHVLACFGGAGAQHACAIARSLGMRKIFVHRFSPILSAYGIALADVVQEAQEPSSTEFTPAALPALKERLAALEQRCRGELAAQGFTPDRIHVDHFLNLRYEGTDFAIMTRADGSEDGGYSASFLEQYRREFGFTLQGRRIFVDDIRVRGAGRSRRAATNPNSGVQRASSGVATPLATKSVYFTGGRRPTDVYMVKDLPQSVVVKGPAILIDDYATVVVEPNASACVVDEGDIMITLDTVDNSLDADAASLAVADPIMLSIFSHRFMSIAEQMGRTLQRTSISTNIKERLDFSCALFAPDGGLVANAPHIPVHLGAMQEAVRYQLRTASEGLVDGDVLVSNHPHAGGSHLPDITVMTPVFSDGKIVFFVASRGHHADIGGISPGSMPPLSKELYQEGAAIKSFKLVSGGEFQTQGITDLLNSPAVHPGCSGTRNLSDNLSDLRAQVAANHRGIQLVRELIEAYSLPVVHAYMQHIQRNAEVAVRDLLRQVCAERGTTELFGRDYMDDGTPIQLRVTIDPEQGSAEFDFEGTGLQVYGNCNAPPAVTYSAIIYCLRCMVQREVPLNQGCLAPITVKIPQGSILNPSEDAAVVGGNVLTSQRVTDVILKTFKACAASQGCMNNLTFGDDTFGYYETIAGGAGAGPSWHGRSGVHTHMTNTRITDPEILERRYPVVLRQFSLRAGSGGAGRFRGGDGVVRDIEFRRPLRVSILSERRARQPFGLEGGGDAMAGANYLTRARDGRTISLGGKNTVSVEAGDMLSIRSPGGGGFGAQGGARGEEEEERQAEAEARAAGSLHEFKRIQESA